MPHIFALFDFSTPELILILAIILLLFGGRKLPELSKSIGESLRELKKGVSDDDGKKKDDKKSSSKSKDA